MQINTLELKQFLEEKIKKVDEVMDNIGPQSIGFFRWMGKAMAFKEILGYLIIMEN